MTSTLRRIVRADAVRSTILGFFAVLILMLISFRNVRLSLLSFVPFLAGGVGMLGLMALFNLEFNFMNIFVGLMIIGRHFEDATCLRVARACETAAGGFPVGHSACAGLRWPS